MGAVILKKEQLTPSTPTRKRTIIFPFFSSHFQKSLGSKKGKKKLICTCLLWVERGFLSFRLSWRHTSYSFYKMKNFFYCKEGEFSHQRSVISIRVTRTFKEWVLTLEVTPFNFFLVRLHQPQFQCSQLQQCFYVHTFCLESWKLLKIANSLSW